MKGDLFTFFVGPAKIIDRYFVQTQPSFFTFCDNFDLKAEAGRMNQHPARDIGSHGFIAGLDIGTIQIRQNVIEER